MNVTIHVLCPEIVKQLERLNNNFAFLVKHLLRPAWPGPLKLRITSQKENGMLTYELDLPPASASDVAKRLLVLNGVTSELAPDVLVFSGSGNAGDPLAGTLTDVDASGNVSIARPFDFVLSDTIPPPEPGEVGLRITGQT